MHEVDSAVDSQPLDVTATPRPFEEPRWAGERPKIVDKDATRC
jgi:hypothetical protein